MKNKGYGECPDCVWYHDPGGCNVERDSDICLMNKRPRMEENIQGKRVLITMNTGARYLGIAHQSSDSKLILSELCIIHKTGTGSMSGSNEKRSFFMNKIKTIEIQEEI
jgi:hypothetical protein